MRLQSWMWTIVGLTLVLGPMAMSRHVAWAQKARNQQEHQHASPHGGQMVTAGKYHFDMLVKDHTTVQVYLYDDNLKPVALPTPEATLYLHLPGNTNHTLTLKAAESGAESSWATRTFCMTCRRLRPHSASRLRENRAISALPTGPQKEQKRWTGVYPNAS